MVYAYCMHYQRRVLGTQKAHKMHTFYLQYKVCIPVSSGDLQKEFPFGVQRSDGTLRLFWCTEKPHSMVHWASNRRTVARTISTNVTESRMKTAVKTKAN